MRIYRDLIHNQELTPAEIGSLTVPQMMWLYTDIPKRPEQFITSKEALAAEIARQRAALRQPDKEAESWPDNFS